MRLNKYISQAGVTSRRKADELIAAGKVAVNREIITVPYFEVEEGHKVFLEGREIGASVKKIYYIMNKP